jgi:ATP-dependent DNA helicase DinG
MMAARREYRETADLIICDHKLFSRDLFTRQERYEGGEVPLLPAYSAVILDEGHHMPETWQRAQGHILSRARLTGTLEQIETFVTRPGAVAAILSASTGARKFFAEIDGASDEGEGKRHVDRERDAVQKATDLLDDLLERMQDELVMEEAMNEGTALEAAVQAYQSRLDEIRAALLLFLQAESVPWMEGKDLWVVPREPISLFGAGRLGSSMPVVFSSAKIEPAYQARVLKIKKFEASTVGVPFDLGEQALVYEPAEAGDTIAQTVAILHASGGRALVLLTSLAEVRRWKAAVVPMDLPWPLIFEGDADRGAQLERFRSNVPSVLFGASFWEGVDVPGEALSCCIIPQMPYPDHDPLVLERRAQAEVHGDDPFEAVDLPEMLIRLKQGLGRLIRTAQDRGVLALLDRSYVDADWAPDVEGALPDDAERTGSLERITAFLAKDVGRE